MKVPNANDAIVPASKIVGYLLSQTHPIGRYKAAFFVSLGYTHDNADVLEASLRSLLTLDVKSEETARIGRKYVVSGPVTGPNGRTEEIAAAWIILSGQREPRFVTAYPGVSK